MGGFAPPPACFKGMYAPITTHNLSNIKILDKLFHILKSPKGVKPLIHHSYR